MAEPVLQWQVNEASEGAPSWVALETALRWTGPGGVGTDFIAGVGDAADAFFDNVAAPNNGQFWHDKVAADAQVTLAGRNANQNVLRIQETGGADPTAQPPVITAFDNDTDAVNRTDPTVLLLAGTPGSNLVSFVRAIETTTAAPGSGWINQVHDAAPAEGAPLAGNVAGKRLELAAIIAANGAATIQVAGCAPHDSPEGLTAFVKACLYVYV